MVGLEVKCTPFNRVERSIAHIAGLPIIGIEISINVAWKLRTVQAIGMAIQEDEITDHVPFGSGASSVPIWVIVIGNNLVRAMPQLNVNRINLPHEKSVKNKRNMG